MAHIAYVRVSSVDQNTERQLSDTGIQFDRTFTDKCSGGSTKRPALAELKLFTRSGDTIHVHSIDRLARNVADLLALVKEWNADDITVVFHKESMTFKSGETNPAQDMMLTILGSVAAFEKAIINERQREGIAIAKEKGVYKNRKTRELSTEKQAEVLALLTEGVSIRKTAVSAGVGVSTVQRIKASLVK